MTTEKITQVPIEALRESPFNPRQSYDENDLIELGRSIHTQGIMQPIVVRPLSQSDIEHTYEIVFGHRRFRASKLAGLEFVPAIIRELDDEQASVQQLHENIKRKDVHPIEEGQSFQRLMDEHGKTVDDIAASVDKSTSHIYARLKLAKLGPDARAACMKGAFSSEVAVLLSRYCRSEKQQKKAIAMLQERDWESDDPDALKPLSYRSAKRVLKQNFCIGIASSPFDPSDAALCEGAPACAECPKLAGNDPELAEVEDADVCTDPACFNAKIDAHVRNTIASAKKRGLRVVDAEEALKLLPKEHSGLPYDLIQTSDVAFEAGDPDSVDGLQTTTFAQAIDAMGKKAPTVSLLVHPHRKGKIYQFITEDAAAAVLAKGWKGARISDEWLELLPADKAAAARESRQTENEPWPFPTRYGTPEERVAATKWSEIRLAIMKRAAAGPRTTDDMRLVAAALCEFQDEIPEDVAAVMGWAEEYADVDYGDQFEWLLNKLPTMSADELAKLVTCLALASAPFSVSHEDALKAKLELAAKYQVDVLEAAGEKPATPEGAAPATEKGPVEGAAPKATKPKKRASNQKDKAGFAGESKVQGDLLEAAS